MVILVREGKGKLKEIYWVLDFRLGFPALIRAHAFGSGFDALGGCWLILSSSPSHSDCPNLYVHCDVCLHSVCQVCVRGRGGCVKLW